MVYIKVARKLSKMATHNAEKGDKCKNLEQMQSKSTKMIVMRC